MSNGKTKHKYHTILKAIAEGDEIEYLERPWLSWKTLSAKSFLQAMVNGDLGNPEYYRVKPKTMNINGYEVPEPVRTKLNDGDTYYISLEGTSKNLNNTIHKIASKYEDISDVKLISLRLTARMRKIV